MITRTAVAAACALFSLHASADALTDVRAALRSLAGTQPVRGTLRREEAVISAGKYANENLNRVATVDVAHDAGGVTVTIPQSIAAKGQSAEDALGAIRLTSIIEMLNARDMLTEMLDRAAVTEEKRVIFRSRPVRQLVLTLKEKPKRSGTTTVSVGSVKSDDKLTLWIADDHLPVAADRVMTTTAGVLFLHGTYSSHTTYAFARAGDRLVVTQLDVIDRGSGMGQNIDRRSTQTLTLR